MTHQPDKKAWSDSAQYVNLGASLADGKGYVLFEGNLWPGQPTIIRAPGWPMTLSLAFRLFPPEWRWEVAMGLAVLLDGLNVLLIYFLAIGIGGRRAVAITAAFLYALSPVMAAMCLMVASEVMGITMVLLFLNYIVRLRFQEGLVGWLVVGRMIVAGLLLGLAALVRPNFVLIGLPIAAGVLWLGRKAIVSSAFLAAIFVVASMVPLSPWVVRNAIVFHSFPILGAGGGETLYGGNNDVAATRGGRLEGYLVLPGDLPGERSLLELASTMNEVEVDRYYVKRGREWIAKNLKILPRHIMVKLKRAYVPISPSRGKEVMIANTYRGLIDLLAIGGVWLLLWRGGRICPMAVISLTSVFIAHIVLVAMFCGLNRFALPSEILLVIPAGYMVAAIGRGWLLRSKFKVGQ